MQKNFFSLLIVWEKRPHEKGDTFLKRERITMTFHNWYTFRYTTESWILKNHLNLIHCEIYSDSASPPKFSIGDHQSRLMKSWKPARHKPCGLFCAWNLTRDVQINWLNPNLIGPQVGPTKSSIASVGPKRMETPHGRKKHVVTDTDSKDAEYQLYVGDGLTLLIKCSGSKLWQLRYYLPLTKQGYYPSILYADSYWKYLITVTNKMPSHNLWAASMIISAVPEIIALPLRTQDWRVTGSTRKNISTTRRVICTGPSPYYFLFYWRWQHWLRWDISRSVSLSHEIAPLWHPFFYSFFLKPLRFVCDMLNHAHNRKR